MDATKREIELEKSVRRLASKFLFFIDREEKDSNFSKSDAILLEAYGMLLEDAQDRLTRFKKTHLTYLK